MGGRVKGTRVLIVLSDEEREIVREAAQHESLPVATFIRRAAVRAARQTTAKAGKEKTA
jgi:uncharacterized protein (DUF1778 family)